MSKALLKERWRNKNYSGLPQWFIDEMVDEGNLQKEREQKEKIEKDEKWIKAQYWPKSKWGL